MNDYTGRWPDPLERLHNAIEGMKREIADIPDIDIDFEEWEAELEAYRGFWE